MEQQVERRSEAGLTFDVVERRLSLGSESTAVGPGAGNEAVLEAYVDLVARCRGRRPAQRIDVRRADLDALATALDLDDEALEPLLVSLLGASTPDAHRLAGRLRARRRALVGVAAVALTAAVGGGLLAGGASSGGSDRPMSPVRAVSAPSGTETDPAVTVTPEGVGLIDPLEVDANEVGLIPAVSIDQDPDATTTTTAPG